MIPEGGPVRAVLDTNVLVSIFVRPAETMTLVKQSLEAGLTRAILSEKLIDELTDVLGRSRTVKWGDYSPDEVSDFLKWLGHVGEVIPGPLIAPAVFPADPDDDWILATAYEGQADAIVTGDKPLLALGFHEGIPIMTPAAFLDELRKRLGNDPT